MSKSDIRYLHQLQPDDFVIRMSEGRDSMRKESSYTCL